MPVQNAEIAGMLDQTGELLEIRGDNPCRARAYRRAARVVQGLATSIPAMLAAGEDLDDLPGIGEDLAGKIAHIALTGQFPLFDRLKSESTGSRASCPASLATSPLFPGWGRSASSSSTTAPAFARWNTCGAAPPPGACAI